MIHCMLDILLCNAVVLIITIVNTYLAVGAVMGAYMGPVITFSCPRRCSREGVVWMLHEQNQKFVLTVSLELSSRGTPRARSVPVATPDSGLGLG